MFACPFLTCPILAVSKSLGDVTVLTARGARGWSSWLVGLSVTVFLLNGSKDFANFLHGVI